MSNQQHPKSDGALFFNNDKQPGGNQPDFRGHIIVTPAQIKRLNEMMQAGLIERDQNGNKQGMKLQVAAWKKTSRNNQPYMFLNTEAYMQTQQQNDGWGAPPQQQQQRPQQQQPQQQGGWGDQGGGWGNPPAQQPAQPQQGPGDGFVDNDIDDVPW